MDGDALLEHQRFLRRLVAGLTADRDAADEVVQSTWLAALEHPPRPGTALGAWLARVARNLTYNRGRRERSEAARRERAGAERSWPPADEVAAQLELAARVLAAVRELPEPLRALVHARYYEERSLEEIARETRVPLDTLKDRLKRARAILRRRLGRELDDGRGFPAALAALLRRAGPGFVGGLLMKKAIVSLAVVLGLALFWGWLREPQGLATEPPGTPATNPTEVSSLASEPVPAERTALSEELPPPAAPDSAGSLLVTVTWPDGSPAERVSARVWREEEGELTRFHRGGTTGADGTLRIDALAPGLWRVQLDREQASELASIRSGQETRLELAVSPGPRLEGVVIDGQGNPVAGAGIWVSRRNASYGGPPLDDALAAISAADGSFAIPSMGQAWIFGARAPGYAPSQDRALSSWRRPVERVRLVLAHAGGAIEGRVIDPAGAPIAGAIVSGDVGLRYEESKLDTESTYRRILNSLHLCTVAADDGSFRFEAVQPGSVQLDALAAGRIRLRQELRVSAGATTWVELVLQPGERLSGRILAPDGTPLAGALVFASLRERSGPGRSDAAWLDQDWPDLVRHGQHDYLATRSGADGGYRLGGLRAGWTFLAADAGERGRELASLCLEPGQETRQDLVLSPGLELLCQIVDQDGRPLAGLPVFVSREAEGGVWGSRGSFRTDAQGRIRVPCCAEASYCLDIRHARFENQNLSSPADHGLRPGPLEHVVPVQYVEPEPEGVAHVRGLVRDAAGRPLPDTLVDLRLEGGGSRRIARSGSSGDFFSEDLPPGTYGFHLRHPDFPYLELPARALAAGETLDLGTLRMETPGFLQLSLQREDGSPVDDERLVVELRRADGSFWWGRFELELGHARSEPIQPGDYLLTVLGLGVREERAVHVRAGQTTELSVLLRSAGWRILHFRSAAEPEPPGRLRVVVRDASGAVALEEEVEADGLGYFSGGPFEPGQYSLEARTDTGLSASGSFTVADRAPFEGTLDFELR